MTSKDVTGPVFRTHYNYKFAISSSRKKQSYVTEFFLGIEQDLKPGVVGVFSL